MKPKYLAATALTLSLISPLNSCTTGPQEQSSTPKETGYVKEGDPMDCTGGESTPIEVGGVMRPFKDHAGMTYDLSSVFVENGITYAIMTAALHEEVILEKGFIDTGAKTFKLAVGESIDVPDFATITLTDAEPMAEQLMGGYGGRAGFCIQPKPGIELSEY